MELGHWGFGLWVLGQWICGLWIGGDGGLGLELGWLWVLWVCLCFGCFRASDNCGLENKGVVNWFGD